MRSRKQRRSWPAINTRTTALEFLKNGQGPDGGWGPYPTVPAEPFDTAIAIVRQQEPDGGWVETTRPSGQDYAQRISTSAWALLALFETRGIIPP